MTGRKARMTMKSGHERFLAKFFSLGGVDLKNSIGKEHDAIAAVERSARGRERR